MDWQISDVRTYVCTPSTHPASHWSVRVEKHPVGAVWKGGEFNWDGMFWVQPIRLLPYLFWASECSLAFQTHDTIITLDLESLHKASDWGTTTSTDSTYAQRYTYTWTYVQYPYPWVKVGVLQFQRVEKAGLFLQTFWLGYSDLLHGEDKWVQEWENLRLFSWLPQRRSPRFIPMPTYVFMNIYELHICMYTFVCT